MKRAAFSGSLLCLALIVGGIILPFCAIFCLSVPQSLEKTHILQLFCRILQPCRNTRGVFFAKGAQSRAENSPGSNAFVPASIHNIGFSVKNIVNDIQFQTAKKGTKIIFRSNPERSRRFYRSIRRKSCTNFGLTRKFSRCILSAYYFKRQRRRGSTAVSLPLFIKMVEIKTKRVRKRYLKRAIFLNNK